MIRVLILLLGLTSVGVFTAGQDVVLGVLEDVPGVYASESDHPGVRVVFRKEGHDWQAFPSHCPDPQCLKSISSEYPPEMTWIVAFDGRNLGQVKGRTPKEFHFYSHVGLQEIAGSVPIVGKRSTEYGGFTDASVYRPLVANSKPYFKDPESWKSSQLRPDLLELVRRKFREKFPKVCKSSKEDETKLEPFSYHIEDVKLVKAYASRKGWVVARLHLAEAIDCEDTEAGFEIDDPWFLVDPQRSAKYLDSGMWLVDAGDYDGDGKSELVFSIDRYNRGGYELFYDDFTKRAVFEFGYH
jgi:hypothetical protein